MEEIYCCCGTLHISSACGGIQSSVLDWVKTRLVNIHGNFAKRLLTLGFVDLNFHTGFLDLCWSPWMAYGVAILMGATFSSL